MVQIIKKCVQDNLCKLGNIQFEKNAPALWLIFSDSFSFFHPFRDFQTFPIFRLLLASENLGCFTWMCARTFYKVNSECMLAWLGTCMVLHEGESLLGFKKTKTWNKLGGCVYYTSHRWISVYVLEMLSFRKILHS